MKNYFQQLASVIIAEVKDFVKVQMDALEIRANEHAAAVMLTAIKEIPKPEKGEKGDVGGPGEKGDKGEDAVVDYQRIEETIRSSMKEQIEKHMADLLTCDEMATVANRLFKAWEAGRPPVKDGKDGADGRDALHLDILPEIVADKAYPRNTYARHKGGIWRSYETTNGERGWECIVNGIDNLSMEQIDERRSEAVIRTSDGTVLRRLFEVPAMIFRGVFKEGSDYTRGDMVAYAGSLWHCDCDTKDKPGDESRTWTLCAKRGRDGKSGKDPKAQPVVVSL